MFGALQISTEATSLPQTSQGYADEAEEAARATQPTEILQVSFAKAYVAHFAIYGGHFISIHIKRPFSKPVNYYVDLRYVEPMPIRIFEIDRPALWVSAGLALLSSILFLVVWLSDKHLFWLTIAIPMACTAIVAALIAIQRSKYRIVFLSRYGRIPWFEMLADKPRRRTVDAYIHTLTSTIHKANITIGNVRGGRLGAELREHRRLMERGILSEDIYNAVKARILKEHG
jgi:hypothetical protein